MNTFNPKTYLFSASSIKEYLQCGLKFKYGRIDKLFGTETPSHHRWFGTLVHSAIYSGISRGDIKNLIPTGRVDEPYALSVLEAAWEGKSSKKDPMIQSIVENLGPKPVGKFARGKIAALGVSDENISQEELEAAWKREARGMVLSGLAVVRAIPKIEMLEHKLLWTLGGSRFVGYIDVVSRDESGLYTFYDFKTTWDKPPKLADDFQFFAYSYGLRENKNLSYFPVGHYVHLRSGAAIPVEVDSAAAKKMTKTTSNVLKNLEAGIFFDDYGGPLCPYCDFRNICYGSGGAWKREKNDRA